MSVRIAVLAVVIAVGCVAVQERPGFDAVRTRIRERVGGDVAWDRDGPGEAVRMAVAERLKGEMAPADAVQVALFNNPALQGVFEELGVSHADVVAASRLRNPTLDVEVKFLEAGGGDVVEFALVQHLVGLVLMPLRKQIAGERFEQTQARVTAAALDLAGEVRTTYRRLQAQRQLCAMLQQTVDATYYAQEAAERLREAGNVTELDVLNERALYEQARADLAMAETAAVRLRERMNVLLGLWDERADAWRIPERLPDPDAATEPQDPVRSALANSLDLEAARREILAVGHRLGLRSAEVVLPELAGGVAGEIEPDETLSIGPAFAVSVPFFDQGQVAKARGRAELRRAYRDFTAIAVRLRGRARDVYVAMTAARQRAAFYGERVLPVRGRITAATQRQVNAMQVGVFALLQAKRLEIEAGRRYVETLRDYWTARTELELMSAGRMPRVRFGLEGGVQAGANGARDAGGGGGEGH